VISPSGGSFVTSLVVTISCATTGASIRFTTNGSEPSESSDVYSAPFVLTNGATIKARAFRAGLMPGDAASAVFVQSAFAPLAHWRFDEQFGARAMDASGQGHTGEVIGATRAASKWLRAAGGWRS
jgi:hypothetical protein